MILNESKKKVKKKKTERIIKLFNGDTYPEFYNFYFYAITCIKVL